MGFLGLVNAGLCATGCPSGVAPAAYKVLFWGGGAALVDIAMWLVALIGRRR